MIKGQFLGNTPIIPICIVWGDAIRHPNVVLDTGFSGDLQVTPKHAQILGLQINGVTKTQIANGQVIEIPTALVIALMEGEHHYIQVQIADSFPLAGINLLTQFSYKAIVDCKERTVELQKAS